MRIKLRSKIIEHFRTYDQFAIELRSQGLKIDFTVISRIVNEKRNPTPAQTIQFEKLLKTPAKKLFAGDVNV